MDLRPLESTLNNSTVIVTELAMIYDHLPQFFFSSVRIDLSWKHIITFLSLFGVRCRRLFGSRNLGQYWRDLPILSPLLKREYRSFQRYKSEATPHTYS